jgi:hypothetical protein
VTGTRTVRPAPVITSYARSPPVTPGQAPAATRCHVRLLPSRPYAPPALGPTNGKPLMTDTATSVTTTPANTPDEERQPPPPRPSYAKLAADESREDYPLRYAPHSFRRWSPLDGRRHRARRYREALRPRSRTSPPPMSARSARRRTSSPTSRTTRSSRARSARCALRSTPSAGTSAARTRRRARC